MSQRYLGGIITANPTLPTLSSASGVWTLEQDFQNSASITPQVIGRSVRLRSSASGYFNRTFGTPTDNNVWTYSTWIKRGSVSAGATPLLRTARVDLLSNGFKVRAAAGTDPNVSGATYIYMAFAENPFNVSRAR